MFGRRRIGLAPSLSLAPANGAPPQTSPPLTSTSIPPNLTPAASPNVEKPEPWMPTAYASPSRSQSAMAVPPMKQTDHGFNRAASATAYNTMPAPQPNGNPALADEFGGYSNGPKVGAATVTGYGQTASHSVPQNPITRPGTATSVTSSGRRPRSAGNGANRLTVANYGDDGPGSDTGGSSHTPWPTAEEEKRRLYEKARAEAERVQSSVARGENPLVLRVCRAIRLSCSG